MDIAAWLMTVLSSQVIALLHTIMRVMSQLTPNKVFHFRIITHPAMRKGTFPSLHVYVYISESFRLKLPPVPWREKSLDSRYCTLIIRNPDCIFAHPAVPRIPAV